MDKIFLKGLVEKNEAGILTVAIATDGSIDRDGEVIDPNSWNFDNFLKNPVLLWAHNYSKPPIGKVLEITRQGSKILFKPQFAVEILEDAKQAYELYKEGFLNAFSVGFRPTRWEDREMGGKMVRVFLETELLEISAVPVPANPNAIVLARGMKGISDEIVKEMEKNMDPVAEELLPLVKAIADEVDEKARTKKAYALLVTLLGAKTGIQIPEGTDTKKAFDQLGKFIKEMPAYEMVEDQVLKDINLDVDKQVVVQIVKADDSALSTLRDDIQSLQKALTGKNGNEGADRKESEKVDPIDALLSDSGTKRLLQIVDRAVGEVLRRGKTR